MTTGAGGSALRLAGVRKRFGATEALRGLDLDVPRGSIFGLIGPNGAGKTTAFSIACGFLRPDAGSVAILGGGGFDPQRLKGRMTAMPQDAALGRETRCHDHLVFFAELQGMAPAVARTAAQRALTDVGLLDRARHRTKTLSHGMLRRLAIAQALLGRPELVLLDEPTSGLDPRHAHELRELLRAARGDDGRTLVVSSHNLPELEALCDHVAFIDKGVVVAAGPTDAVTGRAEEVQITLGLGPEPLDAVRAVLPGDALGWDPLTRVLILKFEARRERHAEDVIGIALRALLDAGARISDVHRGTTLEKRFLELTLVEKSTAQPNI